MSDDAITQNSSLPALCAVLVVLATARHRETKIPHIVHLMGVRLMSMRLMGSGPH
jgi:hypothetical protein